MRRSFGIGVSIAAASCGVLLAACNPPMPPDVLSQRAEQYVECQTGNQDIAVSAEYAASVEAVSTVLTTSCPDQSMTAVAPDQPATVRIIDHVVTPADLAEMKKICSADARYVPVFGTPVGLAYNLPGMDGIILSPEVTAQILTGKITTWNDPKIAADNEGFELPDSTIKIAEYPGATGAIEAMSAWLAKAAPSEWTLGVVNSLPTATSSKDKAAFIEAVTGMPPIDPNAEVDLDAPVPDPNPDAIGTATVIPNFIATENVLSIADFLVDGVDVSPVLADLTKIGISVMPTSTDAAGNIVAGHAVGGVPAEGQFDAESAQVVLEDGAPVVGWPVIETSTMLACDDPNDPLPLSTAQFWIRLAGQGTLDSLGLTPLPEVVRTATFPALKFSLENVDESKFSDSATPSESPMESTDSSADTSSSVDTSATPAP